MATAIQHSSFLSLLSQRYATSPWEQQAQEQQHPGRGPQLGPQQQQQQRFASRPLQQGAAGACPWATDHTATYNGRQQRYGQQTDVTVPPPPPQRALSATTSSSQRYGSRPGPGVCPFATESAGAGQGLSTQSQRFAPVPPAQNQKAFFPWQQ